ncbi:hypothetical protein EV426DRAFT_340456 [Tirmania nivea]|nr:hypothetical protein EV426DRAFT_340456 [Tirmania nivea]
MNATSDLTPGAPMGSGIAARRHHPSLPAFQLPNNRGSYASLGSVLTPPAVNSGEHANPLTIMGNNTATATLGGFTTTPNYWTAPPATSTTYTYAPTSNAPQPYTNATSLAQATSLGYRNPYSPGGSSSLNRVNSRPSSPITNNLVGSQNYESSTQFTAPSGLPSLAQGNLQHQYTGGYSVSNGPTTSSINPQSQTSHDLYSTHSSLPPPTPSHSYYSQQPHFANSPSAPHALSMSSNQAPSPIGRTLTSPAYPHHSSIHPAPLHIGLQRFPPAHMGSMPVHYPGIMGLHPGMPQQERPFKCDQCPQSFNRNHDLKRHKRIHLAVKPFPCDNCEKSFSRKDALKRHRLVKGCGKLDRSGAGTGDGTAESPRLSRNAGSPNGSGHTPIGQIPPRSLNEGSLTQINMTDRH